MPVHMLEALATSPRVQSTWLPILLVAIIIFGRRIFYKLPKIPPELARDLRGQIVFITHAFSPIALPLVESLLSQGAKVIALLHPDEATSPTILQIFAILQNNSPKSRNPNLYIEPLDMGDSKSIEKFSKTWEAQGTLRTGALNENLQNRTHVAGLILFPGHNSDDETELITSLIPSFERTAQKTSEDPLFGRANAQTRIIQVVDTPFYAAFKNASLNARQIGHLSHWKKRAYEGMQAAVRMRDLQQKLEHGAKITSSTICLSVSTGFTFSNTVESAKSLYSGLPWPLSRTIDAFIGPILWFATKTNTEASDIVEWALLAPSMSAESAAYLKCPTIRPGAFYRDGLDASASLPASAKPSQ